jgi:putative ABC transport system permease protein
MAAQQIRLSQGYVESVLAESNITDRMIGKRNADLWFGNAFDIEGKVHALIAERGYAESEIEYGVNWAYAMSYIDPTTVAVTVLVLALILLSGYLIIYSVLAISVTADIHFFGLLKTIGRFCITKHIFQALFQTIIHIL